MIIVAVIILAILWIFGFLPTNFFQIPLFGINGHQITVYDLLILAVIVWLVGLLPSPFRQIAVVILILWILSVLGFLAIAGLSQILIIALILGVIVSLFT